MSPTISVRRSSDRGFFDHGWLKTHHSFSFGDYHDPRYMGFRSLRVINEDFVEPGAGFPTHSHRDMEIVTVVLQGAVEHRDSMGNHGVIRPGEVQRMSAGKGVTHSEFNPSPKEPLHLLQIWILPQEKSIQPGYEQKTLPDPPENGWRVLASSDGAEGSVTIHQDARILKGILTPGADLKASLGADRHAWIQIIKGIVSINNTRCEAGDGIAVSGHQDISLHSESYTQILLFDLA